MAKRTRRMEHPFLVVDNSYNTFHKNVVSTPSTYRPVHISRHHLYPKDRTGGQGKESHITIKLWCYKHFFGWNSLFQFFYKEHGMTKHSELTIDEIITCMIVHHPFITKKVGTAPWKAVFKDKTLGQALDLLCRMVSIKFNRPHMYIVHSKIDVAIPKKIAA